MVEKIKLDMYDKKILNRIMLNGRMSQKKIAKDLKVSVQRVHYKINRLHKELLKPAVILNYPLLGMKSYMLLVEKLNKETAEKMLKESGAFAILQTIGKYQYMIYAITDDLNDFLKKFLPDAFVEVYPIIRQIPDDYNPFGFEGPYPVKKDGKIKLDKKDYILLKELCRNPLESFLAIGKNSGIDRQTVVSRVKKMEEANVIQRFRFAIDIFKLGFLLYFLKIEAPSGLKEKIIPKIRANTYSGFLYETYTGFFMYYMPPSHEELFAFTKEIESIDKNIKIDVIQSTEILKLDPTPKDVVGRLER